MNYAYQNYLAHYGIKGQKKGNRRFQNEDGSLTEEGKIRYGIESERDRKRISNEAAKDAKKYAEAQAYYGKGAGTRRKVLKNQLSEKMKNPYYKDEFEKFVGQQDMVKAQRKAVKERHARDTIDTTRKTARRAGIFMLSHGPTLLRVARALV